MPSLADVAIDRLDANERAVAVTATARAFWPDPLFGFFMRGAVHEHRATPGLFKAVLDDCRRHGEVWVARGGGRVVGSASWLPPEGLPRSASREARLYAGVVGAVATGRNRAAAVKLFGEVERRHPHEPHWYLGLLGVDPRWQGRGVGGLLLQPVLERCDAEGLPAYLETQKEENLAFYGRFTFVARDEVRLPGTPPVWTMWREPQPVP